MNLQTVGKGFGLTPAEAHQRRDRLAGIVKWGAVAGVGLVVAPVAFAILKGITAVVVVGTVGAAVVGAAPVISMKFANWKLKAILDEAKSNPIPTLENELIARKDALKRAGTQLQASLAQVESFVTQAEDAAAKYPEMATRWRERAAKAKQLANMKKRSYQQALMSVEAFEAEVERCRVEWKLVLAEAAMNKSLDVIAGDPLAQLKSRTAIEAVTDRMNEAFAGMEVALLEEATAEAQPVQRIESSQGTAGLFANYAPSRDTVHVPKEIR